MKEPTHRHVTEAQLTQRKYVTVPEKKGPCSRKIKKVELMLLGSFNPPLCCVKILRTKPCTHGVTGNLPYSSRAIEVKKTRKRWLKYHFQCD